MKRFIAILLITVLVLLSIGCTSKQPQFTLESYPRVDGSTVTIPLSEALCAKLTDTPLESVKTHILHNKTHPAYVNLINGKTDLIFVTSPSIEELELSERRGVPLEVVPIVGEAFVFLTHVDNPVDSLTTDQIQSIYSGEIDNWSEVGGPDLPIVAYQRPINSGSQTGFLDLVMKDKEPILPPTQMIIGEMGALIEAVADYQNAPDTLGYSYYYFVMDMWGAKDTKLMKVNGILPEKSSITDKSYPYTTAYYAVFRADEPSDSSVRKIVNWILSDEGQALMEEAGYVKVK